MEARVSPPRAALPAFQTRVATPCTLEMKLELGALHQLKGMEDGAAPAEPLMKMVAKREGEEQASGTANPETAGVRFTLGQTVQVEPRTGPGQNKPGGVGKVVAVTETTVSVKFALDNHRENAIPLLYVKACAILDETGRSQRTPKPKVVKDLSEAKGGAERQQAVSRSRKEQPKKKERNEMKGKRRFLAEQFTWIDWLITKLTSMDSNDHFDDGDPLLALADATKGAAGAAAKVTGHVKPEATKARARGDPVDLLNIYELHDRRRYVREVPPLQPEKEEEKEAEDAASAFNAAAAAGLLLPLPRGLQLPPPPPANADDDNGNPAFLLNESLWQFSNDVLPRYDLLQADLEHVFGRVIAVTQEGDRGLGDTARLLLKAARDGVAELRQKTAAAASAAALEERLLPVLNRNLHSCVQMRWNPEAFPLRRYKEYLETYVPSPELDADAAQEVMHDLETDLPDGVVGGTHYPFDDRGGCDGSLRVETVNGRQRVEERPEEEVRVQVKSLLSRVTEQVVDRFSTERGAVKQPAKALGKDLVEAPVWGIDSYTRVNVQVTLMLMLGWPKERSLRFVEQALLPTINNVGHGNTGTTIMAAALRVLLQGGVAAAEQKPLVAAFTTPRVPGMRQAAAALLRAMTVLDPNFFFCHPKGTGVMCSDVNGIPPDTFVSDYLGELLPAWRWGERLDAVEEAQKALKVKATLPDFYNMGLDRPRNDSRGFKPLLVEAGAGLANFSSTLSHSCDPNCTTALAVRDGRLVITLLTTRHVRLGEELAIDYNCVTTSPDEQKNAVCLCGKGRCRGQFMTLVGDLANAPQHHLLRDFGSVGAVANLLQAAASTAPDALQTEAAVEADALDRTRFDNHGLKEASLGRHPPAWLLRFVSAQLAYVEMERRLLPMVLADRIVGDRNYNFTLHNADFETRAVLEDRVMNLAKAVIMVYHLLRQQQRREGKEEAAVAQTPPPLVLAGDEEVIAALWSGRESVARRLVDKLAQLYLRTPNGVKAGSKKRALNGKGGAGRPNAPNGGGSSFSTNGKGKGRFSASSSGGEGASSGSSYSDSAAVEGEESDFEGDGAPAAVSGKGKRASAAAPQRARSFTSEDWAKAQATVENMQGMLRKSIVTNRRQLRDALLALRACLQRLRPLAKERHTAAADVLLLLAHTRFFAAVTRYAPSKSAAVQVTARELGNNVPRRNLEDYGRVQQLAHKEQPAQRGIAPHASVLGGGRREEASAAQSRSPSPPFVLAGLPALRPSATPSPSPPPSQQAQEPLPTPSLLLGAPPIAQVPVPAAPHGKPPPAPWAAGLTSFSLKAEDMHAQVVAAALGAALAPHGSSSSGRPTTSRMMDCSPLHPNLLAHVDQVCACGDQDDLITLWDPHLRRKIVTADNPRRRFLRQFLETNPHVQLYMGQDTGVGVHHEPFRAPPSRSNILLNGHIGNGYGHHANGYSGFASDASSADGACSDRSSVGKGSANGNGNGCAPPVRPKQRLNGTAPAVRLGRGGKSGKGGKQRGGSKALLAKEAAAAAQVAFCDANEVVFTHEREYDAHFILAQLVRWHGDKSATDTKAVLRNDLFGSVRLPDVLSAYVGTAQYGRAQRKALLDFLDDPRKRRQAWPTTVTDAFKEDAAAASASLPLGTGGCGNGERVLLGSPVLDAVLMETDGLDKVLATLRHELELRQSRQARAARPSNMEDEIDRVGAPADAWVECDKCATWRRLPFHVVPESLPSVFHCTDNVWDLDRATCNAPAETYEDSAGANPEWKWQEKEDHFVVPKDMAVDDWVDGYSSRKKKWAAGQIVELGYGGPGVGPPKLTEQEPGSTAAATHALVTFHCWSRQYDEWLPMTPECVLVVHSRSEQVPAACRWYAQKFGHELPNPNEKHGGAATAVRESGDGDMSGDAASVGEEEELPVQRPPLKKRQRESGEGSAEPEGKRRSNGGGGSGSGSGSKLGPPQVKQDAETADMEEGEKRQAAAVLQALSASAATLSFHAT